MLDVIIVGGGPAGLSAGLILGRSRRRVLICDAGEPRNAASQAVHGFFTREGVHPSELRRVGREQLCAFGVEFRAARVVNALGRGSTFQAELNDGASLQARKLLLAVGVADKLPEIAGFAEFWGSSVFSCPYCHAWEVREQALAVYGKADTSVELALLLTAWTSDVIICSDGPAGFSAEDRRKMEAARIAVREQKIARLQGANGLLEAIKFEDGSFVSRRGIFLRPKLQYRDELPKALGCALAENGAIKVDDRCQTSVAGVYAAGDCTGASGQALAMAADGARAAFSINRDLVRDALME